MKFSLSWLKEHLATEADIHAVAEAMTLAGLEVEDVRDPAAKLAPFSVAKIVSAARHPNADRLQVCQVETVDGLKEIVCGAPNARAGLVTIYAPIGAYVPGLGVTLVEKPVRGVVSNGMLCSASELEQAEESDGILELPETWATGTPAATVFAAEPVIDFEVTPNRPDWLGVSGIARDLAATGLGRFIDRTPDPVPGTFACPITVEVDGETCVHFTGRVIRGVKNGPSPQWLQDRLSAIGLKPISALVDITNFLAYDRARPLHVYDLAKLSGTVVRTGRPEAESDVLMLDGKTVRVTPDMCANMDADGVIGLGGVMGGDRTKVEETTTDIFLECAWFDPIVTAQTGRATGITSDAQYRFARGVDPEFVRPGIELATRLILDLCGGEASEVVEAGAPVSLRAPVAQFDPAYVHQLTGLNLAREGVFEILRHLGFVIEGQGSAVTVHVPSWRRDVEGKADLVEEVARIAGFDALPSTPLPERERKPGGVLTPHQTRARIARRALAAMGYSEAVTWSFLKRDHASLFGGGDAALVLANPIAADLDCM
ncbi:MAG: phenylalanine--tRNA ligase subunit beta, partial [Asticcacaulis sp.]